MEYIYVLKLEEEHYYVGKTNDLGRRYMQHINGDGSKWTQIYKPISIIYTKECNHELDEEMTTLEWMDKKGIDIVRGDCFTNIRLSDEEKTFINKKINNMKNQCYLCNQKGHFINNCPNNMKLKSNIELLTIDELKNSNKFKWLVKNLIPENGLVCMHGIPGCGKTFMALDIGLHITHGIKWNDMKVKKGIVYYIVAEGISGIYNRIKAWHDYHNKDINDAKLFIIEMNKHCLHKREFSDDFIKLAKAQESKYGIKNKLIIIDTLVYALDGLVENSSTDVNKLIKELLYINSVLKTTNMLIHHSNKSNNQIRGSSAILAALDTSISLKRNNTKVNLEVDKQKDGVKMNINFSIELSNDSCIIKKI